MCVSIGSKLWRTQLPIAQTEREVEENILRLEVTREEQDNEKIIEPATEEEVNNIINNLKNRKAPGQDGITNQGIKNFTQKRIELVNIANAIMKVGYFPNAWKNAKVIMLKKPPKPVNRAGIYRPISLLHTLSKIIERIIYRRMKEHTEEKTYSRVS